jgi:hypothetical protein
MTDQEKIIEMGLSIGDTVKFRRTDKMGWVEYKAKLLWIGKKMNMWETATRSHFKPNWTNPVETPSSTLLQWHWEKATDET